jgi:O-antigen ligase
MANLLNVHLRKHPLRGIAPFVGWLLLGGIALLLALLPLPHAVVLTAACAVVILALIDPVWAVAAAILSVTIQDTIQLPGGILVTQATLLFLAGMWGVHILAHPNQRVVGGRLFLPLMLFLWVLLFSTTYTIYNQTEALKETLRWLTVLLVYLATYNSLMFRSKEHETPAPPAPAPIAGRGGAKHPLLPSVGEVAGDGGCPKVQRTSISRYLFAWRVALLVAVLLLAPAANALLGLWQFWIGDGPPSFQVIAHHVRAYGTIGKPNSFAGYLNMGWALGFALVVGAVWQWWRTGIKSMLIIAAIAGGLTALLLAGLLASFSRGGWLGAMGGGAAMLLAWSIGLDRSLRHRIWQWGAVAIVGGVLMLLLNNVNMLPWQLAQRITSITQNLRVFDVRTVDVTPENFAVVERMSHIQAAWHMVNDHPITGVGPGNYAIAYRGTGTEQTKPYILHPWYTAHGHAHNYYLHIAAEAGIGGAITYLLLIAALIMQAKATLQQHTSWIMRSISVGCCGIIGAVVVHNLFENLHVLNMGVQLAAVWGLLAALEKPLGGSREYL